MAFGVFGANPVSDMLAGVVTYLPKVIAAILIIVIAAAIAAAARELIQATFGGLSYGRALGNIAAIAIVTVGAFAALDQLRIAPAIVTGLFYALLAVIAGSAIVAIAEVASCRCDSVGSKRSAGTTRRSRECVTRSRVDALRRKPACAHSPT